MVARISRAWSAFRCSPGCEGIEGWHIDPCSGSSGGGIRPTGDGAKAGIVQGVKDHRFLIQASLQEIRDFGELGRSLRDANEDLSVEIHIYNPQRQHDDDEILQFAAKRNSPHYS